MHSGIRTLTVIPSYSQPLVIKPFPLPICICMSIHGFCHIRTIASSLVHFHTCAIIIYRRMFPLLQVSLSGLQPHIPYAILLEFQLTVQHRWRFLNGEWQATSSSYTSEPPEQRSVYIHPSSTLTGGEWMKDKVTFSKLKLSNKDDGKGKVGVGSHDCHLHIDCGDLLS